VSGAREPARYCPFCGDPVGSFFGRRDTTGAVWCERCDGWFRVEHVEDPGNESDARDVDDR